MRIRPARRIGGRMRVPGDKSVSHRAALLAALCERGNGTRVSNFSTSADCASTLRCLEQLGVRVERDGATVHVGGAGLHLPRPPAGALDCGNSGTTMRLLAGVLAGQNFPATLAGDESLCSRPMRRVIEPLELMGARVVSREGRAPLRVEGRRPLAPIEYVSPVASAQVKSCVLLAGLNADGRTAFVERHGATRDHTERLLRWFGVEVEVGDESAESVAGDQKSQARSVSLVGGQRLRARDVEVPGDISSAAFFIVAAALLAGSELRVEGVGLNPTRTQMLDVLRSLGADVRVENASECSNEPVGEIVVRGTGALAPRQRGASILRGELIAGLIDELPILAVAGTQVEGGLEIRDAGELRVKETDRVRAVCENLRAMGARVEEYADGLFVEGRAGLRGARVRSFGDHRIAMAFAVAALVAEGETEIEGAECVAVSFPEFFDLLESVVER
ncbi:MAG: 3-phosphoshikimate 1-carboxyvinyltransferase [Acidobacteria bacterium]|nr:3-phosphoshikimate 1-carboxyvinyltransferase [Acidobacteriota bacterium]MCA1643387.1 3-phosphoshikimate 1-carboxyvinyltransferase [Acidobacteriota bacterium]